jgi:hypothetical protein
MSTAGRQPQEAEIWRLIAARAYALWESQGRPRGYDVINWHQAEQDVMNMLAENAAVPDAARTSPQDRRVVYAVIGCLMPTYRFVRKRNPRFSRRVLPLYSVRNSPRRCSSGITPSTNSSRGVG